MMRPYVHFCGRVQVFRKPVQSCVQGDRAGICVTQLDPKLIERCIMCTPGTIPTFTAAIAAVERVRFYSGKLPSSSKVRTLIACTATAAMAAVARIMDALASRQLYSDQSR